MIKQLFLGISTVFFLVLTFVFIFMCAFFWILTLVSVGCLF